MRGLTFALRLALVLSGCASRLVVRTPGPSPAADSLRMLLSLARWLLRSWLVSTSPVMWEPLRLLLCPFFGRFLCGFLFWSPSSAAGACQGPFPAEAPLCQGGTSLVLDLPQSLAPLATFAPFDGELKYQMLLLPGSAPVPASMKSI